MVSCPFHSILSCSSLYRQSNESHSEINFGSFIFSRDSKTAWLWPCSQMVCIYQSIDPPLECWWWWWRINSKKMTNVGPGLTGAGVSWRSVIFQPPQWRLESSQIGNKNCFLSHRSGMTCSDSREVLLRLSLGYLLRLEVWGKFFLIDFPTSSPPR